jgi:hypothetical protein
MKKALIKTGPHGQHGKKALASPAIKRARAGKKLAQASIQSDVHAVAAARARSAMDLAAAAAAGIARVAAAAKAAAAIAAAKPAAAAARIAVKLQRQGSAQRPRQKVAG